MPDKCSSCGECAVMEDEVNGGGVQKICIECGTVASSFAKTECSDSSRTIKIESIPFLNVKKEEKICESCGDYFLFSVYSSAQICPECEEMEITDHLEPVRSVCAEIQRDDNFVSESTPTALSTCKSCHSKNLGMDLCGADERLVCRDCGTVAGNEALTNDDFEMASRGYNFMTLPKNHGQVRILKGRVAGHEKIQYIYSKLCFPEVIKDEALEMFDRVFDKPRVFRAHITTKEHIAAACVFIVCRQHDMPVSLQHFRKFVDRFHIFLKGRKIVLKNLGINHPSITLTSQVELVLVNCGFNSRIISKVKDILFLCRKAWLTQGRSRTGLIIIAAYYAYISCSSFISITKFRQMFKFPNISMVLQSECNNLFLKLASCIPWVLSKNIQQRTVYKYIDDILKYQNSLLQLAFRLDDNDNEADIIISETGNKLEETPKGKKLGKGRTNKRHGSTVKEVLVPSILKKPKQEVYVQEVSISPMVNLDSPDVLESEFDETEMSSYLLSPAEQSILRTPKLMYMHN